MKPICFLILGLLCGCAAHWPEMNPKLESPTQSYQVAPKQLLQIVKDVLSAPPLAIGVMEEKDGSVLSGYQSFPGDFHIARRWQERTRYRVTVVPDWNEPTAAARIEVREMTEQRSSSQATWKPAPELLRPERARKLLAKLDEQVRARAAAK